MSISLAYLGMNSYVSPVIVLCLLPVEAYIRISSIRDSPFLFCWIVRDWLLGLYRERLPYVSLVSVRCLCLGPGFPKKVIIPPSGAGPHCC